MADRATSLTQPRTSTVKRLFAVSGNRCAYRGCPERLVDPSGVVVGEICHIKGKKDGNGKKPGPRYDASQSDEDRHGFDNLILMCPKHHKLIDQDPDAHRVDALVRMKHEHENQDMDADVDDVAARLLVNSGFSGDVAQVSGDHGINVAAANSSVVITRSTAQESTLLHEKRVRAAEDLWKATLAMKEAAPAVIFARLDVVTEAEYPKMFTDYRDLVDLITDSVVTQIVKPGGINIDEQSPFIDGELWKRFVACRTLLGRVCVLTMGKVPRVRFWWNDKTAMDALRVAIGQPRLEEVMRLQIGRLNAAWSCFQADMLDALRATLADVP